MIDAAAFERFRLSHSFGPCPIENGDCASFIELDASKTLRVDRVGEGAEVVHQAAISSQDHAAVVAILTDADLRALLDRDDPPCFQPLDVYESMELVLGGSSDLNYTMDCDDPPLVAARRALEQLADRYLPQDAPCGDPDTMARFEACSQATTQQSCEDAGGSWQMVGESAYPSCVCPTGQAGCPCARSDDCLSGQCTAAFNAGSPPYCTGVEGTCAASYPVGGCFCSFDENGKVSALCAD